MICRIFLKNMECMDCTKGMNDMKDMKCRNHMNDSIIEINGKVYIIK